METNRDIINHPGDDNSIYMEPPTIFSMFCGRVSPVSRCTITRYVVRKHHYCTTVGHAYDMRMN